MNKNITYRALAILAITIIVTSLFMARSALDNPEQRKADLDASLETIRAKKATTLAETPVEFREQAALSQLANSFFDRSLSRLKATKVKIVLLPNGDYAPDNTKRLLQTNIYTLKGFSGFISRPVTQDYPKLLTPLPALTESLPLANLTLKDSRWTVAVNTRVHQTISKQRMALLLIAALRDIGLGSYDEIETPLQSWAH
jgi:hypothetical protein